MVSLAQLLYEALKLILASGAAIDVFGQHTQINTKTGANVVTHRVHEAIKVVAQAMIISELEQTLKSISCNLSHIYCPPPHSD